MRTICNTPIGSTRPLSPRQRKFADLHLSGMSASQAFAAAGFRDKSPAVGASRLLARCAPLTSYLAAERQRMAEQSRLARWQVVDFLCRVITTPIHGLPEDSDLIQEHVVHTSGDGRVTRTRVKMINKIDAIKQLYVLLGWNQPDSLTPRRSEEEIVNSAFADLLTEISAGGTHPDPA